MTSPDLREQVRVHGRADQTVSLISKTNDPIMTTAIKRWITHSTGLAAISHALFTACGGLGDKQKQRRGGGRRDEKRNSLKTTFFFPFNSIKTS